MRKTKGELVPAANGAALPAPSKLSDEQVSLIKTTICKGATDDELSLFLMQCERTQLDPFSKQIHAVKRWDSKAKREVMSIQVGIDGFRLIAERTGKLDGQEGPFWCGEDGVWKDVWLGKGPPLAAKVIVHRKGCKHPFVGIVHWDEYKQEFKDRDTSQMVLTPFWRRMPAGQLAKCGEAVALRKAFPQELSGLYAPEEMGQDDPRDEAPEPARVIEHRPAAPPALPAPPKPEPMPAQAPRASAKDEASAKLLKQLVARADACEAVADLDALVADGVAMKGTLTQADLSALGDRCRLAAARIRQQKEQADKDDPVGRAERAAIGKHRGG